MPAIVVDAGGTYLRFGVAHDDGNLRMYSRRRIPNAASSADSPAVWESILNLIEGYVRDATREDESGDAIVFAVPGPVVQGRLLAAPTITRGLPNTIPDIAALLAARTNRSVYLVNDVSAAAWYLGERLDSDRFFVVTVSSGIGAKLFDRFHAERVLDGAAHAGEIGHIVVDPAPNAPVCDCGGRGHLGAISSGRGTERLARHLARAEGTRFRNSAISRTFKAEASQLTNEEHIIPAARQGDPWSLSIIERAAQPLAQTLAALTASVGLERIIVIGGFAQRLGGIYANILSAHMSELLDSRAFPRFASECISVYDYGEEVCLAGAAAFYRARSSLVA